MLSLMMLTHDPVVAKCAEDAGIDRVFYDLEYINKRERQSGRNTVISEYDIDGIKLVHDNLSNSKLVVRVNPIYFNSKNEIEAVLQYSPDYLMLPMVFDDYDVKKFVKIINKRAKTIIMVETAQALARIDSILEVDGIDEIFVGLNDLHIGLGLDFMFEIVSGGLIDYIADKCRAKGIPFGFGGIARIGQGDLPAEKIIGEHYRLGSETVILSRTFKGTRDGDEAKVLTLDLKTEVDKVRARENECSTWTSREFENNRESVKESVINIVGSIKK